MSTPERRTYNVGAYKIPHAQRDIAHAVLTEADDHGFFNILGAEDDPALGHTQPLGAKVAYRVELTEEEAERFRQASNCRYVELDVIYHDTAGSTAIPRAASMAFMRATFPDVITKYHGRDVLIGMLDGGSTAACRSYIDATMVAKQNFGPDPEGADEITSNHGCLVLPGLVPVGGRFLDAIVSSNAGARPASGSVAAGVWCADQGAKIVNYSGAGGSDSSLWVDMLDYLRDRGIQFFASAGNEGNAALGFPASYSTTYDNVHSSISFDEATGKRSSFSNHAATGSGCAPGSNVLALTPAAEVTTTNGTSFSAPHMARLCAMGATGGKYTVAQVGAALKAHTRDTGQPASEQGGGAYSLQGALSALGAFETFAAQVFVSTTGSDTNSGLSLTAPKKTLTAALAVAKPGQTISVAPGTYNGNFITSKGGTAGNYITIRSAQKHAASIFGDNGTSAQAAVQINHQYIRIQDMIITGTNSSGVRYGVQVNSDNVEVVDNRIRNICQFLTGGTGFQGGAGVDFTGPNRSNILIARNLIHHIGLVSSTEQLVHGIYCGVHGTNFKIQNNVIYECEDFGIHPFDTSESSGIEISHNTIAACGRGILQSTNGITRNNIVHNVTGAHYDIRGTGNVGSNNLYSGTGTGPTGTSVGATSVSNPLFVDPVAYDFRLQSGSPAVNAGAASGAPTTDVLGTSRPQGTTVDIGAYEFAALVPGGGTGGTPGGGTTGGATSGPPYRKANRGPRLMMLSAADVGRNGNRADGTGPSLGGAGGGQPTGTPAIIQAAQAILDRLKSGQSINVDWTWGGNPAVVTEQAPAIRAKYANEGSPEPQAWLQAFINSGGTSGLGGGPGGGATSIASLLKFGTGPGLAKFDVGIGFAPGDDRGPNGDGQSTVSGAVHRNYPLSRIVAGLTVPGYFELTADRTAVRMSAHLDGGRTSANTQYPRVEPREYDIDGSTKMAFDPNRGTHYIIHRYILDRMPPDKPELVVCQWHDAGDDVAMVRYRNKNTVEAKLGDTVLGNLTESAQIGTTYTTMIKIVGDGSKCKLEYYWQNMSSPVFTTSSATRSKGWYGKAGCYAQSNSSIDAVEDGPFIIRTLGLGHWHSQSPLSSSPWPEPLGLKP